MLVLAIPMFEKPVVQSNIQDLSLKEILTEAFSHQGFLAFMFWIFCLWFSYSFYYDTCAGIFN